ncbi:putative methyltransferase [Saezia sanguinis]|uniref:Putative methyltransferase n=1 Tax=Saezia sanguinis TaxID=1965230 RepID=A0A433SDX5_9BURK|nr:class I SAM-dependent methyltransferase [Saezia sanguinis]RUS66834.1 putative methyltransferase [Saezia sanguinis]
MSTPQPEPSFKDHFSVASDKYAAHRPTYPAALAEYLAGISPNTRLALDCGCGTGQLSTLLGNRFQQVIATDASPQQIANAQPHARVSYRVATAEHSGLPDACADLITVAQAAHWLNLELFYAEARRVARPHAVIALITYGVLHVEGPVDAIVQQFYHDVIGPYWPAERRHVEEGYRNLPFPFAKIAAPVFAMTAQWRLDDLLGYIDTWSAVQAARKAVGIETVHTFQHEITLKWGASEQRRTITWPLSMRVGHISHHHTPP